MTKDEALKLALKSLKHMLEDAKQERLTVEYWNECVDAITAIKQARALDKMAENARELGLDYEPVQEPSCKDCRIDKSCSAKGKDFDVCSFYVPPPAAPVQEPVAWNAGVPSLYPEMKDGETISVEYTTPPVQEPPPECQTEAEKRAYAFGWWKALEANRAAPVQEPVACDGDFPEGFDASFGIPAQALRQANAALCEVTNNRMWDVPALAERMMRFRHHTTPPAAQRQWVGLTQQDIDIAFDDTQEGGGFNEFAHAIEAKLKEKNT